MQASWRTPEKAYRDASTDKRRLNVDGEEEGEEWGEEYAAFGPGLGTSAPHLTEEEAAGVYVQPLEEGNEAIGQGSVRKFVYLA